MYVLKLSVFLPGCGEITNRPGEACSTITSVIDSLRDPLVRISSIDCNSQTIRAKEAQTLKDCSPHTMAHMSLVACHMSHITCHMSHVTSHMSIFINFYLFFDKMVELVSGVSVINRAIPSSLSLFKVMLFSFYNV